MYYHKHPSLRLLCLVPVCALLPADVVRMWVLGPWSLVFGPWSLGLAVFSSHRMLGNIRYPAHEIRLFYLCLFVFLQIDNHKKTLLELQKLPFRSYFQLGLNLKYIYPITFCIPCLFPSVLSEFGGGGGGVFRAMPERKKVFFFQEMLPNKVQNTFRNSGNDCKSFFIFC